MKVGQLCALSLFWLGDCEKWPIQHIPARYTQAKLRVSRELLKVTEIGRPWARWTCWLAPAVWLVPLLSSAGERPSMTYLGLRAFWCLWSLQRTRAQCAAGRIASPQRKLPWNRQSWFYDLSWKYCRKLFYFVKSFRGLEFPIFLTLINLM